MSKATRIALVVVAALAVLVLGAWLWLNASADRLLAERLSRRFDGREVSVGDVSIDWGRYPLVRVEDLRVDNPAWAEQDYLLDLPLAELRLDPAGLLQGEIRLERVELERPQVHLARQPDGPANWETAGEPAAAGPSRWQLQLGEIAIDAGRFTYSDPERSLQLSGTAATEPQPEGARHLVVEAAGGFRQSPLQVLFEAGVPEQVAPELGPYAVHAAAELGDTELRFDGRSAEPLQFDQLQGELALSGPRADEIADLLELPAPEQGPFELRGRLARRGGEWQMQGMQVQLGESDLRGEIASGPEGRLDLDLEAETLNLDQLLQRGDDAAPEPPAAGAKDVGAAPRPRWGDRYRLLRISTAASAAPPAAAPRGGKQWDRRLADLLAPLRDWRGTANVRTDRLIYQGQTYRDVVLQASREQERIEIEQLGLDAGGGRLETEGWLRVLPETVRGELDTTIERMDLGEVLAPYGYGHVGSIAGELGLAMTPEALLVREANLSYRHPAEDLALQLQARTGTADTPDDPRLHLTAEGQRRGQPFRLEATSGPLLDLDEPQRPYPVEADLYSLNSSVHIEGSLAQPLRWKRGDLTLWAQGPNLADWNPLTGLTLPPLPPYELRGQFGWDGDIVTLRDAEGTVGESDFAGDVRVRRGEQPKLWATLASDRLDLDDLAPLIGGVPATEGSETASPEQRLQAKQLAEEQGVLPEEPWDLERLHRMDAVVDYRAAEVSAPNLPLQDVRLQAEVNDGVLRLNPLEVGLGGGELQAQLVLDAAREPALGAVDLTLSQVNLKQVLREFGVAEDSFGHIGAKARLYFRGGSVAAALGTLDGRAELIMRGGRLDMMLVELAGLDAGEALMAAVAEDTPGDEVPINCAYAGFDADSGRARLEQFLLNTTDTNFTGGGVVDFKEETLELVFEGHPKDASALTASSPVELAGRFTDLSVDAVSPELLGRAVLAALTALVAPPAALLPLVTVGPGEGVGPGCGQVLADYRTSAE